MITWIVLERTSVNDDTAILIRWLLGDGTAVTKSDEVAEVETSKAVYSLLAGRTGYLRQVAAEDQSIAVGGVIGAISDSPDEALPPPPQPEGSPRAEEVGRRRWTMKAELLARKHGIDIRAVPGVGVIQEADIPKFLDERKRRATVTDRVRDVVDDIYGPRKERLMVLGAGRGGVQVVDAILRQGLYRPVGLLDDDASNHGKTLLGVPIVGMLDDARRLYKDGVYDVLIIAFSNDREARAEAYHRFKEQGIPFGNVIDPSVIIHSNVQLGTGNVILASCRLGSCTRMGNNNFLSAYVNIEHHNVVGDTCTFGPGVSTSSRVLIGNDVKFGTGIFIEPGVRVGDRCVVASGSIVTSDVDADCTVKSVVRTVVRRRG